MTSLKSVHDLTEADVRRRALDHDCPDCGAKTKVRFRILTKTGGGNSAYPSRTKVDVQKKPCPGRAQLAWREMLAEG